MNSDTGGSRAQHRTPLFEGQFALVFGACHSVAKLLVRALARRGAFVVAADSDEDGLMVLARSDPRRIETLSLAQGQEERSAQLFHAWRDQPLHIFVSAPEPDQEGSVYRRHLSRQLSRFGEPLRDTPGRALCLFSSASDEEASAPLARAEMQANCTLIVETAMRDGFTLNGLSIHPEAAPKKAAARALTLLTPVTGGISGAFMPLGRNAEAPAD